MCKTQKAQDGEAQPSSNHTCPLTQTQMQMKVRGVLGVSLWAGAEPSLPRRQGQRRFLSFFHPHSQCCAWTVHSPACLRRLHPNQNPRPDASPAVPVHSQEAASLRTPSPQHTRDSTCVPGRAGENASWDWQHLGIISAPLVQTIG